MARLIIELDNDVLEGTAAILKMQAKAPEKEMLDRIVSEIKDSPGVEVPSSALKDSEAVMALCLVALGAKMEDAEKENDK